MTQNRKRPHDAANPTSNGDALGSRGSEKTNGGSNESSPQSKRSLIASNHSNLNNIKSNTQVANSKSGGSSSATVTTTHAKQPTRLTQKSTKPTQSINRVNAPEDIYYAINTNLNQLRHDLQIVALRKLARKPYKPLASEYQKLYDTFGKLAEKAHADTKLKINNDVEMDSNDAANKNVDDKEDIMTIDEKTDIRDDKSEEAESALTVEETDAEKMSQTVADDKQQSEETVEDSSSTTAPAAAAADPTVVID